MPKTVFVLALAAAAGTSMAAIAAHAQRRMVPVSTTIKEMIEQLDAAGRNGTKGDEADAFHDDVARASDALRARTPQARAAAERAIRKFRGDEATSLTYLSTASNPYRDDDGTIETYVDDNGYEYWIDPANDVLVQAGPAADKHRAARKTGKEDRLPVPELRNKAVAIIGSQIDDFSSRRSRLHPLEDNKGREVYFFRWDDFSGPVKETEMPPFVQVGLYADGTLASFTDTLTR